MLISYTGMKALSISSRPLLVAIHLSIHFIHVNLNTQTYNRSWAKGILRLPFLYFVNACWCFFSLLSNPLSLIVNWFFVCFFIYLVKQENCGMSVCNGKIYILGGRRENGEATDTILCYDPATSIITGVAAMPRPVSYHGCVTIHRYNEKCFKL